MICIHPAVTHNQLDLLRLMRNTGLNVVRGNKFLRLSDEAHKPKAKAQRTVATFPTFPTGPFGGDAA